MICSKFQYGFYNPTDEMRSGKDIDCIFNQHSSRIDSKTV